MRRAKLRLRSFNCASSCAVALLLHKSRSLAADSNTARSRMPSALSMRWPNMGLASLSVLPKLRYCR